MSIKSDETKERESLDVKVLMVASIVMIGIILFIAGIKVGQKMKHNEWVRTIDYYILNRQ